MKITEYYKKNYPSGKPWEELTKEEQRVIRRKRRRENWVNIRETLEDVTDIIDFVMMILGRGKDKT